MQFFINVHSVGQAKTMYRKLAKLYHPDLNGPETTAAMQAVNAEYHSLLSSLDGSASQGDDGKEHVYRYNQAVEQEIMDKVAELLKLRMVGVEIELVGTWIWVYGDTRSHKEALKALGCSWHSKRTRWYWRQFTYRRTYSGKDFDTLRRMYGSQSFENESDKAMVAA